MDTRTCPDCGATKPINEFKTIFREGRPASVTLRCIPCNRAWRAGERARQRARLGPERAEELAEHRRQLDRARYAGMPKKKRNYIGWSRSEVARIRRKVAKNLAEADRLEYRAEFPIEPRLDVKNWDRTHDAILDGRPYLVDHVVVARLVEGRPAGEAGYNRAEQYMAILRLHQLGLNASKIAHRVGLSDRESVTRILWRTFGLRMPPEVATEILSVRRFW